MYLLQKIYTTIEINKILNKILKTQEKLSEISYILGKFFGKTNKRVFFFLIEVCTKNKTHVQNINNHTNNRHYGNKVILTGANMLY